MYRYIFLFFIFITTLFSHNIESSTIEKTLIFNQEELKYIKNNSIIDVGVEEDWPPFDFVENGVYKGIAKDYLDLIEKKSGLKFRYNYGYTWNELLELAKNKKIDLLPVLFKNKKREEYLEYTKKSYISIRDYLYSSKKSFSSLEELNGKKIAIPRGYAQETFIKNNYPNIEIYYVKDILSAIDAVILNKADAFISNVALVQYLMKKHNISGIKAQFLLNKHNELFMATKKDSSILKSIIDKSLDLITIDEKNLIYSKWIENDKHIQVSFFTNEEKNFIDKNKKIYIANELDWIPYDYYQNAKPRGFVIDYVKLLFSKIGIEPIFISDKWPILMEKFKNKEIDLLPVIAYKKEREEFLFYTKEFLNQELILITNNYTTDIVNIDDLDEKKVAMVKGWALSSTIKKNFPNIKLLEFDSLKEVFNAIKNNIADATIQNKLIGTYYLNKEYSASLKSTAEVKLKDYNNKLFMGVNKNKEQLVTIVNKSMDLISQSELDALNDKWLNISKEIHFTRQEQEFIDNKIVNVAYTDNWAPMSFEENGKAYGLGFDFWQYVVKKSKLKVNLNFKSNFTEALDDIKNKRNDIIITTSKTSDRQKYSIFTDIYFKAPLGIATLQESNYIPDGSYLLNKRVGVGENYTAHKLLKEAYPNMKFVLLKNVQHGLELLSNGKIDALVESMPILAHNIRKYAYSNIKISGSTGINFDLQMMIRDDYEVLQSIINKVLKTMTPDEKREIYEKWSKLEYTQAFDYSVLWKYFLPLLIIIVIILYKNKQLLNYQNNLKKTQKELENTVENFRALINLTIEGIFIIKGNKILFSNIEALRMFNINKKHLHKIDFDSLFKVNDKKDLKSIISEAKTKTYELRAVKRNNKTFPILLKSKTILFKEENCDIVSVIDMSEIKDKEQLIIQQSKMASLGEMIGNIAHQWRQPLSFISTAATGMKLQKEFDQLDDKTFNDTIDNISQTTMFLSQTIDDFQNYLKTDKTKMLFNLSSTIEKLLNIVKSSFTNNFIDIELSLDKQIDLNSFENELNQALLNIINNSKDALKDKDFDDRFIKINTFMENNYAIIEIIDNAGGINPEIIDRVFEPYFTTKHKSQGTGLGLYMTHKIISESLSGEIKIENISYVFQEKNFNKCAKVSIKLPLS
ncbi:transporter substrate-binding domain-containing protein [Arcobacter roscoffensis]|uniref:histidine kinase n=1 Tax=Arcobacter roscoffensis TaxID=2961520 RepID=A0ABY5DYX6_9BACT|nr:transporter substrate-binding domain-containing protein [Arcobacter roscoffensis]UTJ05132.1 transporter substrate-binding domain-containing protein [Arcobacter roscoffensis]